MTLLFYLMLLFYKMFLCVCVCVCVVCVTGRSAALCQAVLPHPSQLPANVCVYVCTRVCVIGCVCVRERGRRGEERENVCVRKREERMCVCEKEGRENVCV